MTILASALSMTIGAWRLRFTLDVDDVGHAKSVADARDEAHDAAFRRNTANAASAPAI